MCGTIRIHWSKLLPLVSLITIALFFGDSQRPIAAATIAPSDATPLPLLATQPSIPAFDIFAFQPGGKLLATVSPGEADQIMLWDIDSGDDRILPGYSDGVTGIAFSPNGQILASANRRGQIRLWDVATGKVRVTLGDVTAEAVEDIVFGANGRLMASKSEDATVRIWDTQAGTLLSVWDAATQGVVTLAFSADGTVLAGGCQDGDVILWDVKRKQIRSTLSVGTGSPVTNLVFNRFGSTMASVTADGRVALIDWRHVTLKHVLEDGQAAVTGAAFTPDGASLASVSADSFIRLWDLSNGTLLSRFSDGSGTALTGLMISADGHTLATVAQNFTIFLWDLSWGDLRHVLVAHSAPVVDIIFRSTKKFASVSQDGRAVVWDLDTGLAQSETQVSTPFSGAIIEGQSASAMPFGLTRTMGGAPLNAAITDDACATPPNAIVAENCIPGTPPSEWDVSSEGDPSIQGFATDISVDRGQTVNFKIDTNSTNYHLDIYRMGYYGGFGARRVATVRPSVALPQIQHDCLPDVNTGLFDCGTWSISASWAVPQYATSGIYFAKAVRDDTGGASHIFFVVRDDTGASDLLFKTSDATWQAYNAYGRNSLYVGDPAGRAYAVSYNRPILWRSGGSYSGISNLFNAEYPMVRWLEANGYDVSYFTSVDSDRLGTLIQNHAVFLSVGHDEYWSAGERESVEAALESGVNLAFFSGNEIFWKTRWESSIDGGDTPYRTLVCYKETLDNTIIDPLDPPTWTGTWRDPRFSPPADGGYPENALTGQLFTVNGVQFNDLTVGPEYGKLRFWRYTDLETMTDLDPPAIVGSSVLGFEWDQDLDNGYRPAGLIRLSSTTAYVRGVLADYGSLYLPGTATHSLTLYRHSSGALVFGAGTVQWSWGLDGTHDNNAFANDYGPDTRIQQATVNLFADMGAQPGSLQSGLIAAEASTDVTAPISTIARPVRGATLEVGIPVTITGTAADAGGGVVAALEVSVDAGATWHPATGRESWTYTWTPTVSGAFTVQSRAVDDSGNLEIPDFGVGISVAACTRKCMIWPASTVPERSSDTEGLPIELGVKFSADTAGTITGIRFYKGTLNTGTHVGNLWSSDGTLLGTVTFHNETASGWQQADFAVPVPISANTLYIASYHAPNGGFAVDRSYFSVDGFRQPNSPLYALSNGEGGGNGVYIYGPSGLPSSTFMASNYWVDVAFSPGSAPTLQSIVVTPGSARIVPGLTQPFRATGSYSDNTTRDLTGQTTWGSSNTAVATIEAAGARAGEATGRSAGTTTITASLSGVIGSTTLTVDAAPLALDAAALVDGTLGMAYSETLIATGGSSPYHWSVSGGSLPLDLILNPNTGVISGTPTEPGTFSFTVLVTDSSGSTANKAFDLTIPDTVTIWPSGAVPGLIDSGPDSPVELGVKFKTDRAGIITGIRFYKGTLNTGTHVGNLWSSTGNLLATATFANETDSGWQQVNFSNPVPIVADTTYVASYHTSTGHYSFNASYFLNGVDNPPLRALGNGVSGGNGVFSYGAGSAFPTGTYNSANYWVDVAFSPAY